MNERAVAWTKDEPVGVEHARIAIADDGLRAIGVAIGSEPKPYRLDYELDAEQGFVTSRVGVVARGEGWSRRLELRREDRGQWSADADAEGELDLPAPGAEMSRFAEALDPDLGLSPVFNSLPVLRHGLLDGGEAPELLMTWISVPDLAVYPSRQQYTHIRALEGGRRLIGFEGPDPVEGEEFSAEISFDHNGVVVDYPGIATRLG